MSTPVLPQKLGSVAGIAAVTAAPTLATDGFPTNGYRFINFWVKPALFTSVDVTVYLYRPATAPATGWVLYTDVPLTTVLTANGGGFLQLEPRGAVRIALRINTVVPVAPFVGTVSILAEGMTY